MAVYKEYFTGSNSEVWKHFLRDENGETAKCKLSDCQKVLKIGGGTTRGLHTHLFSIHKIQLKKKINSEVASTSGEPPKKRLTTLTDFYPSLERKQKSLPATPSRLTALDGLSFNVLCHSLDLRAALSALGFGKLPASPSTICKIVLDYANEIRNFVKAEIADQLKSGKRFSLSFDEWTSLRNRRYMNVNVHAEESKFWSLGLVRISGTMPAEKCIQLLEEKLNEHGLNLHKDIVSIMTDGASVMTKVGKLLLVHQQLCLAHGIQLAVIDVLYKKLEGRAESEEDTEVENLSESESETEMCEEQEYGGEELVDHAGNQRTCEVNEALFGPLIKKVRKIVSVFKRSPTKNDDLQKYVREDFGKEIPLVKDCKTRWSSLLAMLERFYLLRNCVQKALIDVKLNISTDLSQNEIQAISEIVNALTPIKATVEALCRQDANLIIADIAISFTLKKLQEANNIISQKLFAALTIRMKQRRTDLSGLLYYLHNGSNRISQFDREFILVPTPTKCRKLIVDLLERMDATSITTIVPEHDEFQEVSLPEEVAEIISVQVQPLTTAEEMNKAINDGMARPPIIPRRCESLASKLQKEMALFENGGSHGDYLKRVFRYLKTIKPTSIESERAFSSAGLFCNRLRSSLGDKVLDELCFLRCHFQQQKKA